MFCLSASLVAICDTDILPSVLLCASVYVRAYMRVCMRACVCVCEQQVTGTSIDPFYLHHVSQSVCVGGCVRACLHACKCACTCESVHAHLRMHACGFFSSFCCVHLCLIVPAVCVFFPLFFLCAFVLNCTSCLLLIFWVFCHI